MELISPTSTKQRSKKMETLKNIDVLFLRLFRKYCPGRGIWKV